MNLRTLTPSVIENAIVCIRVDFNVPLRDGVIQDPSRIEQAIPTLRYLLEHGASQIHIFTHIGRPKSDADLHLSTQKLVPFLSKILNESVEFRSDFTAGNSRVQIHENTRFFPEEKKNDAAFIQRIMMALQPDIFVNDAFSVSHRAHASVVGFAKQIPCYAGFLLEKEVQMLLPFCTDEKQLGLTVVMSGVKMETKIPVLEHFAVIADNILLGGGMANTFLVAQGYEVGTSVYEPDYVKHARRILKIANQHKTGIHLPVDVVCADTIESTETLDLPADEAFVNLGIFDIGVRTIQSYSEILNYSHTIIWNGPLGVLESEAFAHGTKAILECIRRQKNSKTIIGGGDTIKALRKWNVPFSDFTHVSMGGGAMLQFLGGTSLPGIEIVLKEH